MILEIIGVILIALAFLVWYGHRYGGHGHSHGQGHGHGSHETKDHKSFAENYMKNNKKVMIEKLEVYRQLCLEPMKSLTSGVPELKKQKAIRVVEIGAGPGLNAKYYPKTTKLIVVDPNPYFKPQLEENLKKFSGVELEHHYATGAEDMSAIPDNSVDAVVATFVMCQIKDLQQVYNEVCRILVPGGKMFFMDHVADPKWSLLRLAQIVSSTFSVLFTVGGRGDLDVEKEIRKAKFASVDLKRYKLEMGGESMADSLKMQLMKFHVYGVATAP